MNTAQQRACSPLPIGLPLDLSAIYESEFDYVWHSLRRLGASA